MSASNKKKIRKEQRNEQLTQRQLQEQKEAKKLKLISAAFITGLALILVAFIGIAIYNSVTSSGIVGKWTTVATIGDHKLSLTEFNYYYVDAVTEVKDSWYSSAEQYAETLGMTTEEAITNTFGIDVSKPLSQIVYDEATGQTWADYMVEEALANARRDYVLYDAAMAAGFQLSADDQATLDSIPTNLENYATWTSYGSAKAFIREAYGYGEYATVESYVEYTKRGMIADAYYAKYSEDLKYDDAALRAFEGETPEDYNSYSYAYYTVNVSEFLEGGTTADDGTVTYSAEEKEAARAKAEATANDLIAVESLDEFNDKIGHTFSPEAMDHDHDETEEATDDQTTEADKTETEDTNADAENPDETEHSDEEAIEEEPATPETAITSADVLHSASKSEFREWMAKADTVKGSGTIIPIEATTDNADGTSTTEVTGYYAVYLFAKSENKKPSVNVRHLLVQVTDTEDEAAWTAAKAEAEKLLADWKAGEATEDSFHTLVHDNTDDTASAETGGLYENVRETSSYVDNFLAWCIDDARKDGETGIVETEYGYHIMYFVGRNEMSYRDQMISDKLRVEDTETWLTGLVDKSPLTKKNFKKFDKDMVNFSYT